MIGRIVSYAALAVVLAAQPSPASAQFVCTTTSTDLTCINSGASGPEVNSASGVVQNATTNNSGTVTGTANSGALVGSIITQTSGGGTATTNNSGAITPSGISTVAEASGNAITNNSGAINQGSILTQTLGGGSPTFTNTGSFNGMSVTTDANNGGNAVTTNAGTLTTASFVTEKSGIAGTATTINSGILTVTGGTVQTATGGGGDSATINSGTIVANVQTITSIDGNSTTNNSGTITGAVQTVTFDGGNAATSNSGAIAGNVQTNAAAGGNAATVNSGVIAASVQTSATGTGNAATGNYGVITGNITTVASGSGTASMTNYGAIAGNILTRTNSGNVAVANYGAVQGQVTLRSSGGGVSTLVNAGVISNPGGVAIMFTNGPDTLVLQPGSFIIGAINLAGAADIVNVQTGNLNLTFNTLAGATVTGTVPFVVAGNQIASVDPTPFALADRIVMDFTRAVSGLIESRTGQPAAGSNASGTAMAFAPGDEIADRIEDAFQQFTGNAYASNNPPPLVFKNPAVAYADGSVAWASGFIGEREQRTDGAVLGGRVDYYGGAIGLDRLAHADLRLGALVGGGATSLAIDQNTGGAAASTAFGALYGRYDIGASFFDFALLGGYQQNSTTRNINNNLAPSGLEIANASFGSWFLGPQIGYGRRYALDNIWSLTPALRLRYLAADFAGYTESGSTADLTVGNRLAQDFEERSDLTLTGTLASNHGQSQVNIYGGVLGRERVGAANVSTVLLGQSLAFAAPGPNDIAGGYAGVSFDWRSWNGISFFAGGEVTVMSDSSTTVTAKGGVNVAL